MTEPRVDFGEGRAASLPDRIREHGARSVLLVCGDATFASAGVEDIVEPLTRAGVRVRRFRGFASNARIEDVERGVATVRELRPEAIVAIGGGTALDLAKAMRALAAADEPPRIAIRGRAPLRLAPETPPLIAMPTTAGTGAEVTPFSAIYIDGVKHALDDPAVAPDEAIVDPELTAGMPRALAASTGADALCQAVESYWSVRSTEESRALAGRSIELVLAHLALAVSAPSATARAGMSRAALDAGRAIAITRTTAPHAVSYALAARGDFAHGQACALTLPAFFLFTSEVNDDDVNDPRGAAFVRERVLELTRIIGASDASSAAARLSALFDRIGLATHLDARSMAGHIASISSAVDASRAGNHPRRVTSEVVSSILISLCEGRA